MGLDLAPLTPQRLSDDGCLAIVMFPIRKAQPAGIRFARDSIESRLKLEGFLRTLVGEGEEKIVVQHQRAQLSPPVKVDAAVADVTEVSFPFPFGGLPNLNHRGGRSHPF